MTTKAKAYSAKELYTGKKQRVFQGRHLLQIAMPMGGIGSGCISLNGQGGLQDFAIRNTPETSAMPDGHDAGDSIFATIYLPESGVARMIEGPMPVERVYNQGLKGQGHRNGGHEGLPRFRNCTFRGEYPFGLVNLSDPSMPLQISVNGFSPFIPLDDKNSSIPCVILEYTFKNPTDRAIDFEFGFHSSHLAKDGAGRDFENTRNAVIPDTGVYMYTVEDENAAGFGSCAIGVVGAEPVIKAMWFRGGWFDGHSALWREVSTGAFTPNDGAKAETSRGRNGGSFLVKGTLPAGGQATYPVIVSWYFPNVHYAYGELKKEETSDDVFAFAEHGDDVCGPDCDCRKPQGPRWKPYYASQWKDAKDVLKYVRDHYTDLRQRTQAFHDALFRSTLPGYVLDAVSANLAIIKSPTVLRQLNGNLWAWEGCFCNRGCCHGSCTHVWNYAQAFPHLFPALERTFREQELERSMDERGHVNFRSALPDGPVSHSFHPASDGQLGGVMKVYREWQVSGDKDWLYEMYPDAKRSMDFCIDYWDPDHLGVLMEPHHNTYDIEFWGPDGMCSSFYLGALAAMAALARAVGRPQDAVIYDELGRKGAAYLDEHLFNGEYFEQKVMLHGLRASLTEAQLKEIQEKNPEEYDLLIHEGPKYQYGTGCITDGVFGAWLAKQCGVVSQQNAANIRKNLKAIFEYNFKTTLWDHANPQRPGYAIGDEPGLLLCTWPNGGKPTLPFVYSDEVWTGIEYQAAAHMIAEGLVDEGLTVVKALRSRYDGLTRNPWNEYECGNFYARAMASYGLLTALSGFWYSAPDKTLYLDPKVNADNFEVFISTATGWGNLALRDGKLTIALQEGHLEIEKVVVRVGERVTERAAQVRAAQGKKVSITL